MKFFIDTANLKEIQEAQALGVLDGVTTNPSLMAKEGITGKDNIMRHYKAICDLVDGDVSAEVISIDLEGMIREGEELIEIDDKIVVKIPMIKDNDLLTVNLSPANNQPKNTIPIVIAAYQTAELTPTPALRTE